MKISPKNSTNNCHFYSREKSLYVAWACFRNVRKRVEFGFFLRKKLNVTFSGYYMFCIVCLLVL